MSRLRKPHLLVALACFALAGAVRAQESPPAPSVGEPATAPAPDFAASMPTGGRHARMEPVAACKPFMPVRARRANAQGATVMGFTIGEQGQVIAAQILKSSGRSPEHHLLDRAALDGFAQCPFAPGADAAGQPAITSIIVTYVWTFD